MLELPTNTSAFFGTVLAASLASKALMSFSHFPGGTVAGSTVYAKFVRQMIERAISAGLRNGWFMAVWRCSCSGEASGANQCGLKRPFADGLASIHLWTEQMWVRVVITRRQLR